MAYGTPLTVPGEPAAADESPAREAAAPETHVVAEGAGADAPGAGPTDTQWQLWEVFTQEAQGAPHEHAGSVRAADAAHAMQNARDVYGRRGRVLSMWVVPTAAISATTPGDAEPFFDPGADKPYRHPHFYKTPRGVRGL